MIVPHLSMNVREGAEYFLEAVFVISAKMLYISTGNSEICPLLLIAFYLCLNGKGCSKAGCIACPSRPGRFGQFLSRFLIKDDAIVYT